MKTIEIREATPEQLTRMRAVYRKVFDISKDKKQALATALGLEQVIFEHPAMNPFSQEARDRILIAREAFLDAMLNGLKLKQINEIFADIVG